MNALLYSGCIDRQNIESSDHSDSSTRIVIDGLFEDWESVATGVEDQGDAPGAEFDLGRVRTQHDHDYVHVMISIDRDLNVQGLDGSLSMLVDVDGRPTTGVVQDRMTGVDLIVQFTPPNERDPTQRGMGIGVISPTDIPNPETESRSIGHGDIGFKMAPTYASQHIEFSMSRHSSLPGVPALFQGRSFALKFILTSKGGIITDETEVMNHVLTATQFGKLDRPRLGNVTAKEDDTLRLMTWNVEFGTILKKTAVYERILNLIDPDVLLLQELTPAESSTALLSFLNNRVSKGNEEWHLILSQSGGSIGCGIATRLPIEPVSDIALIARPDRPDWFVRALGGKVTLSNGRRLLVASLHLKCCGRIGSEEDQTRLLEVKLINRAIKKAILSGQFDGIVIGGDLNLVGGYEPIESLGAGLDFDQSDLTILHPYRLDNRSNATWGNPRGRFAPGRLDYLLMSGSSLIEKESFVFNSTEVSPESLAGYPLKLDDSAEASDHYPIVLDLTWNESIRDTAI